MKQILIFLIFTFVIPLNGWEELPSRDGDYLKLPPGFELAEPPPGSQRYVQVTSIPASGNRPAMTMVEVATICVRLLYETRIEYPSLDLSPLTKPTSYTVAPQWSPPSPDNRLYWFVGEQEKPYHRHSGELAPPRLRIRTANPEEVAAYFDLNQWTYDQILAQHYLYSNPAFVAVAKQCPGYESTVSNLSRYLHTREHSKIKKLRRLFDGICDNNARAIMQLHREIQEKHCAIVATVDQKLIDKPYDASDPEAVRRYDNRSSAVYKTRANPTYTYEQSYKVDRNSIAFAQKYQINKHDLTFNEGTAIEHCLHQEFIEIAHYTAVQVDRRSFPGDKDFSDIVGASLGIGLQANKAARIDVASDWADIAWTAVDCCKAMGEGVVAGTKNIVRMVTHPIETVENTVVGIAHLTMMLAQATGTVGECIYYYNADHDQYCIRRDAIAAQLSKIQNATAKFVKETPVRDYFKMGAQCATEQLLAAKALSLAHKASSMMAPKVHKAFEYLKKNRRTAHALTEQEALWLKNQPQWLRKEVSQGRTSIQQAQEKMKYAVPGSRVSHIAVERARKVAHAIEAATKDKNKIHHILTAKTDKHLWSRVCSIPLSNEAAAWKEICPIIEKSLLKGEIIHKGGDAFSAIFKLEKNIVEVRFVQLENNMIDIGSAWIQNKIVSSS